MCKAARPALGAGGTNRRDVITEGKTSNVEEEGEEPAYAVNLANHWKYHEACTNAARAEQDGAGRKAIEGGEGHQEDNIVPYASSVDRSAMVMVADDHSIPAELFPEQKRDVNSQQLDLRRTNSWLLTLSSGNISTPELAEVFAINAMAPFILASKLKPLLTAKRPDCSKGWYFVDIPCSPQCCDVTVPIFQSHLVRTAWERLQQSREAPPGPQPCTTKNHWQITSYKPSSSREGRRMLLTQSEQSACATPGRVEVTSAAISRPVQRCPARRRRKRVILGVVRRNLRRRRRSRWLYQRESASSLLMLAVWKGNSIEESWRLIRYYEYARKHFFESIYDFFAL